GAGGGQGGGEGVGAVAGSVVGEHPFDHRDAVVGEPGGGAGPEPGGGVAAFVGEDLGVGKAGGVVDRGVQVAVSGLGGGCAAVAASRSPAEDLVAAAVGNVAQLLDVHVHQLTGPVTFVTSHYSADVLAGGPVQVGQAGQPVAAQDRVDGGGGHAEVAGEGGGAPA